MSNDRPKGSYSGPLSLQWCAYSMTVRAMPMNYLAADLSRIDAALWGRESEIGAAIAEAPAMVEALREVTKALGEIDDYPMATGLSPDVQNNALDKAFAILSRIDGAGNTLPDAPVPAPTGELVTVRVDHLAALVEAAGKYADDLETGLEDGTYDDRADLDAVRAALAVVRGEN